MKRGTRAMDATIRQPTRPSTKPEHQADSQPPPVPPATAKTPQEFYAEVTRRPDVRAILEELADR